jgi:prevent-host-death family protein
VVSTAGVSQLKAALSEYLARVKAGGEVVVTERGRPIARLVPVKAEEDAEWERLRVLERAGEIRLGSGRIPESFWTLPRIKDPKGEVRSALMEEREAGW